MIMIYIYVFKDLISRVIAYVFMYMCSPVAWPVHIGPVSSDVAADTHPLIWHRAQAPVSQCWPDDIEECPKMPIATLNCWGLCIWRS